MKTSDVPHLKEHHMADAKKSTTTAADKDVPDSTTKPEPVGATPRFETGAAKESPQAGSVSLPASSDKPRAAESGDPAVHAALAHLQAAEQNRDSMLPPSKEALKEADDAVKAAKDRLRELGYPQD